MTSAGALSEHLERTGVRQIGPFRLDRELGKGGFAPVYLAREMHGGVELRTVAVKVFAIGGIASITRDLGVSRGAAETRARERIVEEARALCRVEHPNVVRFYQIATDASETLFALAMEHVTGTSLAERLRRDGKLSVRDTINVGIAVASALSAVHRVGLIHRDLKPANIVEHNGVSKLIDFGIASFDQPPKTSRPRVQVVDDLPLAGDEDASQVTNYTVGGGGGGGGGDELLSAGTIGYMDPACVGQQLPANATSDLYALGATLFECLTGSLPARAAATARGLGGLRGDVIDGRAQPPPVRTAAPDTPEGLARVIDALLDASRAKRPQSAERIGAELERLRRAQLGRTRPLPDEDEGPFRGLSRFDERHRDLYFGRTAELAASLEILRSRGLLALMGPSGSGKSSLGRAAVLPAIEDGALAGWPHQWNQITLEPGRDPRGALLRALSRTPSEESIDVEELIDALAADVEKTGKGVVIFVDQLEELVTVSDAPSREWIARFLRRVGDRTVPGVRAVVAARIDLLDSLLELEDLARALPRSTVVVSPMSVSTWIDVIDQALDLYGYRLEAPIGDDLAPIVGSMPLVQFGLRALWQHRDRSARTLPAAALTKIGGFAGALDRHAEATLAAIGSESTVRRILLALTTSRGTRATVPIAPLDKDEGGTRAREALEEARLLVREPGGVTLAHEALTTQWRRLARWLSEVSADRVLADEIESAAALWSEKHAEERLYRRTQLREAEALRDRGSATLSPIAVQFLSESRRVERRVTIIVSTAFALIMIAAIFGAITYVQRVRERDRETASALELVGRTQFDSDKFKKHVQNAAEGEVGKLIAEKDKAIKERDDLAAAKKKVEADLKTSDAEKQATEEKLKDATAAKTKLAADVADLKKACAK